MPMSRRSNPVIPTVIAGTATAATLDAGIVGNQGGQQALVDAENHAKNLDKLVTVAQTQLHNDEVWKAAHNPSEQWENTTLTRDQHNIDVAQQNAQQAHDKTHGVNGVITFLEGALDGIKKQVENFGNELHNPVIAGVTAAAGATLIAALTVVGLAGGKGHDTPPETGKTHSK